MLLHITPLFTISFFFCDFRRATELLQERYYLFSVTAQTRLGWGGTARALVLTTANRAAPAPPARPNLQRSLLQPHHITFSWTPGDDGYAPLRYCSYLATICSFLAMEQVLFLLGHSLDLLIRLDAHFLCYLHKNKKKP